MFSPHPAEILFLLLYLAIPLALVYLVVRFGVRHGTIDAHRRLREEGSPSPGDDPGAARP